MNSTTFRGRKFNFERNGDFWAGIRDINGWEPETFNVLEQFLAPGKTLLDIGAWNGICSLYAASLGAKSYAVEPDATAYAELVENIALNCPFSVFPVKGAVAAFDGKTPLYNFDKFGNSMSSTQLARGASYDVDCCRLETLFGNTPFDLIKMDIESAELTVVPDALKFMAERNKPLYLAVHPYWYPEKEDLNRLRDLIQQHFTIAFPSNNNWLCLPI